MRCRGIWCWESCDANSESVAGLVARLVSRRPSSQRIELCLRVHQVSQQSVTPTVVREWETALS